MDDEPIWAADRVVASTSGFATTILETANEFAIKDEGSKILHSIERSLLEEEIFAKFNEFMAMTADKNYDSKFDTEDPPFEKITINTDYKIKTSLKEPPINLKLKPVPDNLEYVFLEEASFLPVIISSQLSNEKKDNLSILKKYKQAFSWKTTDIPGICPSFCKHKIQLLDDKKLVVQRQKRLNPNMQEVVKKEIVKLLDTGIIYPIADSPWVSPIHCVSKKESIKEFMDDFSVFRNSFETCLINLDKMLQHCKDAHLVLNWEKCNFMVKEGIMLGHKVSSAGLKVDKAKIDAISKLSPLTNIKEIKDRKGTDNVVADHLSRIENDETNDDSEVDDNFPRETLMKINTKDEPWFSDFANYLVKEYQEKDKIETKPDQIKKKGKRGKARKSQKQSQDCACSIGTVEDKILVPKPSKNYARCARCGYLVDGPNCQGCALLRQKLEENLVTHSPDLQNTSEPSNASTNVVNAPREPYVVKQDNGSFVDNIMFDLHRAPASPNQFHCFHCKDVLRDGEACKRCTCAKCRSGLGKGLCYICGHNQNSLNDSPRISETSSHSPPIINHCCYECGDPLDGIFCK
nr:retrovirus-related Pol polyprotein [Tanacetum cinerariifolium]